MSTWGQYAALARRLGPSELARVMARRAHRSARRAWHRRRREWNGARLAQAFGPDPTSAVDALLGAGRSEVWCDPSRRDSVLSALERLPGARERAAARAARALARCFDVFGHSLSFGPGKPIEWSRDPLSSVTYPLAPSESLRLNERGADPKYPWVLGRLDQLVALGQGYWIASSAEDRSRHAEEAVAQMREFFRANPVGRGVHWACPMEIALRAANVAQALRMFSDAPQVRDPAFCLETLAAVIEHASYVEAHLEDHLAVPNNHLVANLVGLLVVGTLLPALPGSARWMSLAARGLREQVLVQVHEDGCSFEGSVPYHRLATELFSLGWIAAEAFGISLGRSYVERLRKMFSVADAYCSEAGLAPQIGDNDSGRAWPLCDRVSLDHGYLAPFGAALLSDPRLKPRWAAFPDEAAWLLGAEGLARFERLLPRGGRSILSSRGGGLHVIRGGGALLAVSAGPQGQRGVGGHSHNDKLSFELHLDGRPLVVDSGTATYTRDPNLRNAFRSTAAHNTVQVDEGEQAPMDPARLFSLPARGRCELRAIELGRDVQRLIARFQPDAPLTLERTFALDLRSGGLVVRDQILGEGLHGFTSRLHLPDADARLREASGPEQARARAVEGAPADLGPIAAELGPAGCPRALVFCRAGVELALEPAQFSPGYGELRAARRLVVQHRGEPPVELCWVILFVRGAPCG